MKRSTLLRKGLFALIVLLVLANIIAGFHAYKFTHFSTGLKSGTRDESTLSLREKMKAVLFGVSLPRPVNSQPDAPFETIALQSNKRIECWLMPADSAIGTVILFHGYGGSKSGLLGEAAIFRRLHYNTFLADFMGSGGSEGMQTTIGFKEAAQVKTCVEYIAGKGERHIILFGASMGAAAILKAVHDDGLQVNGLILECPFGTMLQTVRNRFRIVGLPHFPMANLLVFWGGMINGFNAFNHNPEDYARSIRCPTLLMHGARDPKVSESETSAIYTRLVGPKRLVRFPDAGHSDYLAQYEQEWTHAVDSFLKELRPPAIETMSP